ncbi:magnesium-dependent phosphatase 1-like [Onthophagus taurus]|uniref:magnesium-dependent phosphatase 1-like n=1 Tax=Onthophagus taurus TaxID=166361 RepID=UPI000C20374E|nr:magnesium-dependent phosphatase 1-like [Onthophagus taurus]
MSPKPKLIVFDLDYTLWPFWVDTHVTPPFHKGNGKIFDKYNNKIKCYPEVPNILQKLHKEGYQIGVASRTGEIDGAQQLISLFDWKDYFGYKEIYPGSKVTHFRRIKSKSGLSYDDMIFFDDEYRNIDDLTKEGVLSIFVRDGVSWKVINEGLEEYAKKYNKEN